MDPPWLYCPQLAPGEITLDDTEGRHAERSRRLRPGDAVTLFDGRGRLAPARLVDKSATAGGSRRSKRTAPTCALVELIEHVPAPTAALTLITAACKGSRLDWLVEKCTELGVTTLVFADCARSVVHLDDHHLPKLTRTAIEACKQAGRPWLPRIELAADLPAALKHAGDLLLVAHPDPTADPLGPWLVHHARRTERLATVVGPEGGLTPEECDLLRNAGAHFVRLGAHILRVETAAVALAAHWATAALETN